MRYTLLLLLLLTPPISFTEPLGGIKELQDIHNPNILPISELRCLQDNIYHEARGESMEGMLAVAQVVMNRVRSWRWPDSVCGVVRQNKVTLDGYKKCQFSWFCEKGDVTIATELNEYRVISDLAIAVYFGAKMSPYRDIYFYYACDGINKIEPPYWAKVYEMVVKIDNHCFYSLEEVGEM